jgi:hypothetical protein
MGFPSDPNADALGYIDDAPPALNRTEVRHPRSTRKEPLLGSLPGVNESTGVVVLIWRIDGAELDD